MAKRILNMTAEEMTHATKSELIEAIAGSVCSFHGSRPDPSEHV